jgi:TolB-like protein
MINLAAIIALGIVLRPTVLAESIVSKKTVDLISPLIKGYTATQTDKSNKPRLAVLPLSGSRSLEQQNIGFAFSEIMTHKFVQEGTFNVIERTQISAVLKEQHFGQTGAIDANTAAQAGKIMGAHFIVVGSVEEVGKDYLVNARLVDAESANVIATSYEEIPISSFDKEAEPYLKLVPPQQSIGLYFLYNAALNIEPSPPSSGIYGTTTPEDFDLRMYGFGLRYFPHQNIIFDAAFMKTAEEYGIGSDPLGGQAHLTKSHALRGSLGYTSFQSSKMSWQVGVGLQHYDFKAVTGEGVELKESVLFTKAGLEFRPQQRLGLGLNAYYNFETVEATFLTRSADSVFSIDPLSFEATLALYF